jgi:hypothetical protein
MECCPFSKHMWQIQYKEVKTKRLDEHHIYNYSASESISLITIMVFSLQLKLNMCLIVHFIDLTNIPDFSPLLEICLPSAVVMQSSMCVTLQNWVVANINSKCQTEHMSIGTLSVCIWNAAWHPRAVGVTLPEPTLGHTSSMLMT